MKLSNIYIKLLAISGSILISSIGQLSAMQSKQSESMYNVLMEQNYGNIWSRPEIQQATKGIESTLEYEKFDDTLSKFHNKIMLFITNNNIKECSNTKLSRKATEKFLKDFIKKNIIAPKRSLEENMNNLIHDVNDENEDIIFNLIIEDYTDKCIKYNPIDLQQIFNTSEPSGTILSIVQQYNDKIYEKFRLALVSLGDYDYFENKYKNIKTEYHSTISNTILNKLTKVFGNYLISFIENNGWNAVLNKYNNGIMGYIKRYINNHVLHGMFEDNIINNNISIYTTLYKDFKNKYSNKDLQAKWEDFINNMMLGIFDKYIEGNDSIVDMMEQFLDPEMKGYVMNKYTTFLENRIKEDIEKNKSLDTILSKYKNERTKNFVKFIFNDLKKKQQQNSKEESK